MRRHSTIRSLGIVSLMLALVPAAFTAQQATPTPRQQAQGTSDTDRLEAARICAERVSTEGPRLIEWKKGEMKKLGAGEESDKWDFSGHFNGEMKRCFVELEWLKFGRILTTALDVYDAFDGQQIGTLMYMKREGETQIIAVSKVFGESVDESVYRALMRK